MLGIDERTAPAIEAWYESFLSQLDAHFAEYPYLLGGRASIGDFGLMAPLYAHLYRDPAPGRLMRRIAPNVAAWVECMNRTRPEIGDWLPDDVVPDTLIPILRRQFDEQFPVLADTAARLAAWLEAHPEAARVPRKIGTHTFRIGEVEGERGVLPFSLWMAQRPLDYYRGLAGGGAAAVLALFHTAFNVLGVLLFLPLTPRLVAYLATRFGTAEEDIARAQFLDSTLLGTPALALEALARELDRAAGISRGIAVAALRSDIFRHDSAPSVPPSTACWT